MDLSTALSGAGVSAGSIALLYVVWNLVKSLNHKKLKSNCCGRESVVAIDVVDTSPISKDNPLVQQPLRVDTQKEIPTIKV